LGFDMLYSLSEMVFSTSGWIMKTNIVSASSLIIQDETQFRPIISCQNVWGVARLGKWILWGPWTKSLRITVIYKRCLMCREERLFVRGMRARTKRGIEIK